MQYNRFDIVEAHYAFAIDYHSGQWSDLYKRQCRISRYFQPGAGWSGYESLTDNGKAIYYKLRLKEYFLYQKVRLKIVNK